MTIAGLVKSSLIDYPGLIAGVLFTPGCNYDCFYCQNRPLVDGPFTTLDTDEVWTFLKKRTGQLDGIVVTGGEPTLQPDLTEFLCELKQLGYKVKLDTNGSNPGVIEYVLNVGLADYIAVDYKAPAALYSEFCGNETDAQAVLQTINLLFGHHVDFEVRTTVFPQLSGADLSQMARELPLLPRWRLNRYRKPETYKIADEAKLSRTPYTAQQINDFAQTLRQQQPNAQS